MLSLLLTTAFAVLPTRVFTSDEEVLDWIASHEQLHPAPLPVVGPPSLTPLERRMVGDLRIRHVRSDQDPGDVAREARLEFGTGCALVLAPLPDGWAGWTSGACGMLSIRGWRWEDHRLRDGTGRTLTVHAFATAHGDADILRTHRRIERRKGLALVGTMIGTGLLFATSAARSDNPESRVLPVAQWGSAGLSALSGGLFLTLHRDLRSRPRRLDAWYPESTIRSRVRAHNVRVGLGADDAGRPPMF